MNQSVEPQNPVLSQRHFRFTDRVTTDLTALLTFADPARRFAVETPPSASPNDPANDDTLTVLVLPLTAAPSEEASLTPHPATTTNDPDARPPIFIKSGLTMLTWQPGYAVLQCEPPQADSLMRAILDFTHYETELGKLEREIASTWHELEQDKSLAFQVTSADLARSATIGARVDLVLERRIRHARIEPHLQPDPALPLAAQKLGRLLREKANTETRLETVDGQLEVFEDVYEMGSQRLGEFRASSQEHTLEWVIIVLLAAETLLMAAQAFWHFGG